MKNACKNARWLSALGKFKTIFPFIDIENIIKKGEYGFRLG